MEMDSPENDRTSDATTVAVTSAAAPSDSVSASDSAIFSYINNLSPIKPVKAAPVVPDFQGLSSPPIVFTSPHLNPLRESNSLKSSRCPQLSPTELFQKDNGNKKNETNSDELGKSQSQSSSVSVSCVDKDCDNKGPLEDEDASPSGRIDEYLADGADVDSGNSAHSASLSLVQSDDMPQSLNDSTDLKEIEENFNKNDTRQDAEQVVNTFPGTLELSGPDFHGKSSIENKPAETDAKPGGSERPSSVCPKIKSGFFVDHASEEQHCELPVAQHAGASRKDELDCGSAFLSESVQPIQGYEDCNKTTRETSNESFRNMVLHDPMGQHHRAMHRRCLQFKEVEQIVVENTPLWSSSNVVTNSRLPDSPADLEVSESSCLEISTTSSCRQLDHLTQPIVSMISPGNSGNSRSVVSKRSGIGLHLNSVVNATLACGASGNMKSVDKAYLNERGRKMVSVSIMGGHRPENKRNSSTLSNVRQNLSTSSKDGTHETQVSVVTNSLASWPPQIIKSSNDRALLEQSGYQTTPCDEMKSISGHADAVEELNHLSPKKKRTRALVTNDGDGCKRCNCKKSKCLKLYCDCFAAGIYCAEPCACQGCFNRPEYEDTVLETRQQIESRNPLAFAPKVVQLLSNSPAASNEEDGNNSTPSSARHKRGCNCKKSMCLKKYCECYQSNVGCSNGCRCEGCQNVFGKKEEYVAPQELIAKVSVKERFESRSDENLEMVESRDGLLQTEMCNKHNLTPLTPSFQFSNHGKDASKAQFSTRRCLPSPESNHTLPKSPESPGTSDNLDMLLQDGKDVEGIDQELNCSNIERTDHELSTAYGGYANVCAPNRLPNPPSTAMAYSMSSEISGCTTVSRDQLCPGSGHLSSVSSLHWRISPMTPAQFGGDKLAQAVDSDDKLHSQLEDDTPEILKNASSPSNAVKVSSPNKKRVAPPHNCLSELRSSSSSGLRSGRKFILQAVPSFPPLTPCMDSKGSSSGQNVNDPQDFSEK